MVGHDRANCVSAEGSGGNSLEGAGRADCVSTEGVGFVGLVVCFFGNSLVECMEEAVSAPKELKQIWWG